MSERLRLGVAGLGRGFSLMLPTLRAHPLVELVAAADPRPDARDRFAAEFKARAYESVEALCADDTVEAVYVATPHQFHGQPPLHSGAWGLATLEVCAALLQSAAERRDIALRFQVPAI